jgi:hypothetical protein
MRGADNLIAMRMRRRRTPSSVVLSLHERPGQRADEAWLMPGPRDRPETADLRLLVGLRVVVAGHSHQSEDVVAWCTAAEKAGALVVMGYATDGPLRRAMPLYAGGNVEELTRRVAALEAEHGAHAAG